MSPEPNNPQPTQQPPSSPPSAESPRPTQAGAPHPSPSRDAGHDRHQIRLVIREDQRFMYLAILLVILCVIGFGILIRVQNLSISSLTDSVSNISSAVKSLASQRKAEIQPTGEKIVRLANGASIKCQEVGGQLAIAKRPDGGQYGLCLFGPDRQCEEWALFRGECPEGGVDISHFGHPADVYCAVTGNHPTESLIPGRAGKCTVKDVTCAAETFYETGECPADVE